LHPGVTQGDGKCKRVASGGLALSCVFWGPCPWGDQGWVSPGAGVLSRGSASLAPLLWRTSAWSGARRQACALWCACASIIENGHSKRHESDSQPGPSTYHDWPPQPGPPALLSATTGPQLSWKV